MADGGGPNTTNAGDFIRPTATDDARPDGIDKSIGATVASAAEPPRASGNTASGNAASAGSAEGGTGTASGDKPKRKYTRRNKPASPEAVPSVEFVTGLLLSSHAMLSAITKTQELVLDENEGKALAGATVQVMKQYPGAVVSERTVAWVNLATIAGMIYGPRIVAISARTKAAAKERAPQPAKTPDGSGKPGNGPQAPGEAFGFGSATYDPADLATVRPQPPYQ